MVAKDIEDFLVAWISIHLNNNLPLHPSRNLATYGIDSIRAVLLAEDTMNMFGFEWPAYLFFEDLSISQLAAEGLNLLDQV